MIDKKKNTRLITKLVTLPVGIQLAVLLGRILPRKIGLKLASLIGSLLGSFKASPMVKAIRANQWVIHRQSLTKKELAAFPKIVFRSAVKCNYDFYYFLSRPEKLHEIVRFSPKARIVMDRIQSNKPSVVVCPHLSNFDLMGYVLALHDINVQVLSFPNPNASYKLQNQLRESLGMRVTPMSLSAFREARIRLREGGSILTGLDRHLSGDLHEKYQPEFFGFKAHLPVTYVRMAKEANAPVFILAATSQPDGSYYLVGSDPVWMESAKDLEIEILNNANRVLKVAEGIIQEYSNQWAMFYPIWPQFLGI